MTDAGPTSLGALAKALRSHERRRKARRSAAQCTSCGKPRGAFTATEECGRTLCFGCARGEGLVSANGEAIADDVRVERSCPSCGKTYNERAYRALFAWGLSTGNRKCTCGQRMAAWT
jgi:hypothetical protein